MSITPEWLSWLSDLFSETADSALEQIRQVKLQLLIGADTLSRPKGHRVKDGAPQLIELPALDGRYHADIPGRHVIASPDGATVHISSTWG